MEQANQEVRVAINPLYLEKLEKITVLKPELIKPDGTPNKKRIIESALDKYYDFLLSVAQKEQKVLGNIQKE